MKGKLAIIIIILAVLVLIGAGYYYESRKPEENQVFCTQEALLCPDGSYVGRHGSQCAFNSCPNAGSLTGKLNKTAGNDFQLIMESPDTSGMEITYALPLEIKNSNASGQLIGKKVEVFGVFGEGNNFKVDRLEEVLNSNVTLSDVGVGKKVFINGILITLNKIVQDSRCPIDVQCIQAGSVTANVSLKSDTDSETIDIESDKPAVGFDSFLVSIKNIKPPKVSGQKTDPQGYILTFKVVSR